MVTLGQIFALILAPPFLVNQIRIIGLILAGCMLVYFGSFVHNKIIFPFADWVKTGTYSRLSKMERVSWASTHLSEAIATIIFILYVYFGAFILSEYLFTPILSRLRSILLIIVLVLFCIISFAINKIGLRRKFMGR